eukprot:14561902-Alexandrium_andersonii.AAC.1
MADAELADPETANDRAIALRRPGVTLRRELLMSVQGVDVALSPRAIQFRTRPRFAFCAERRGEAARKA